MTGLIFINICFLSQISATGLKLAVKREAANRQNETPTKRSRPTQDLPFSQNPSVVITPLQFTPSPEKIFLDHSYSSPPHKQNAIAKRSPSKASKKSSSSSSSSPEKADRKKTDLHKKKKEKERKEKDRKDKVKDKKEKARKEEVKVKKEKS